MECLIQNRDIITQLSPAIISAAVAIIVFALSHWATSRRERIEHLIQKLEELYLLLNKAGEDNLERYNIIRNNAGIPNMLVAKLLKLDDMYGLKLQKKIIMYVRLYFPQLSIIHAKLFFQQDKLNTIITNIINENSLSLIDTNKVTDLIGKHLKTMEQEIIDNQALLVGKKVIFKKFKSAPYPVAPVS